MKSKKYFFDMVWNVKDVLSDTFQVRCELNSTKIIMHITVPRISKLNRIITNKLKIVIQKNAAVNFGPLYLLT